jgi:hypothetical protein
VNLTAPHMHDPVFTIHPGLTLELSGGEAVRLERVVSLRTRNRYALNGS